MPICITCNNEKAETEFHTTGKNRTLKKECKHCINEKRRNQRKENPDKYKAIDKQRYEKDKDKRKKQAKNYVLNNKEKVQQQKSNYSKQNKDKIAAASKKYYISNKEKLLNNQKKYYIDNKERIKEYKKQYNSTEKGRINIRKGHHQYRAKKVATTDNTITIEALQKLMTTQNNTCYHCKCPIELNNSNTHLDHYVPLSKGGIHSITNVVWSCAKCNLTKNNKLPTKDLIL